MDGIGSFKAQEVIGKFNQAQGKAGRREERVERRETRDAIRLERRNDSAPLPPTPIAQGAGAADSLSPAPSAPSSPLPSEVDSSGYTPGGPQGLSADIVSTLLDTPKSLVITAQEIVAKINEQLKIELPEGVESLSPEQVTPEATATAVVSGVTASFDRFRKSNGNLSDEEAITNFVAAAKRGVEQGYEDAYDMLKGLGAFEFEGVEAGVQETRTLILDKLAAFEKQKRVELGIDPAPQEKTVQNDAASSTNAAVLAAAGKTVSFTA